MALQVWITGIDGMRNLGLGGTRNLGSSTSNANGKIGTCLKITTNYNSNCTLNPNTTDITMCGWFKFNLVELQTALNNSGYNSSRTTPTGNLLGQNSYGGLALCYQTNNLYASSGAINSISVYGAIRDSNSSSTCSGLVISFDTWTHVVLTWNHTTKTLTLYINGVSKATSTNAAITSITTWNFQINTGNVWGGNGPGKSIPLYFNDIRCYNNLLSEDEIHELSLGKIGHWKLNDAEIEPTTNILNSVTATCYNAANSKYGYSTTSNVLKTDGEFLNKQCTKIYPATNGSSWRPYTYLPTFVSNGGTDPKYKTLQFDYYSTTSTYLNPYKLGDGNSTAHWKCINSTGVHTGSGVNNVNITVNPNEWNHVEIIFEGTSSASAHWGYFINGNAVTSSSNTYHLYANVMVEEKDHSTPYTKTSRVKGNVPDISGNHHDLTVNGNPTLSDDSVRYDKSCLFGSGISLTPLFPSFLTNEATVSMWVKLDQLPPSSPGRTMLYTSWVGFSCEVTSAGKTYFRTQLTSGSVDSPQGTITAGNWTHWVGVKSSTGVSLYLNGALVGTTSNSNNFNWSSLASNAIGAYGGSYYTYGKLSDVRLYATALSADDILKLYKLGN